MSPALPTRDEFFGVFTQYNEAVWPLQLIIVGLALVAAFLALREHQLIPLLILAFLWAWTGLVFHLICYTRVSSAGYLFGAAFIAQSALILNYGRLGRLRFGTSHDAAGLAGALFIAYALILYPKVGRIFDHVYPAAPVFSAPCPVTIFTLGMLLWTRGPVPLPVLIIPFGWSIVGSFAAIEWGVAQDMAMPFAAIVTAVLLYRREHPYRTRTVVRVTGLGRPHV